jgi:hypothetical protein
MYIRLFANSQTEGEALSVFENVISYITNIIKCKEIKKIEPYWKIEGVYEIGAEIELNEDLKGDYLKGFLNSISDKWIFYGNPANEVLASDSTESCTYLKVGVKMINILL